MNTKHPSEAITAHRASLSRRHFLRGLGVCLALPAFESFPVKLLAAGTAPATMPARTARSSPASG